MQTRSAPRFVDIVSRHSNLEYLVSLFSKATECIIDSGGGFDRDDGSVEAMFKLLVSVLGILCACSCHTHLLQILQNDNDSHILKCSLGNFWDLLTSIIMQ